MPLRRPTLLIVGCGDIGLRVLRLLRPRWRVLALSSSPERAPLLRDAGAVPLLGNLDECGTLGRLAGLADHVLHLAPPPAAGLLDLRTRHLVQALARGGRVRRLVYASTSGVYGDCQGQRFDETRPVNPGTDRARRRVDAETVLRWWGRRSRLAVTILRVPGIYALDRTGGNPRERLLRTAPVLDAADDVPNHHADDRRLRGRAAARRPAAGGERLRRHRPAHGRLLRSGGRPVRPGPAAAPVAGRGCRRAVADAAELHG
jgi:nucleoside-diphosphate-sugar epimerase